MRRLRDELGRAVPARHDVLCELRVDLARRRPREAKVADLEIAVLVDEEVAWLEVAVDGSGRVDRLEPSHELVRQPLDVRATEGLLAVDYVVQVGGHEVEDKVQVVPRRITRWHDVSK